MTIDPKDIEAVMPVGETVSSREIMHRLNETHSGAVRAALVKMTKAGLCEYSKTACGLGRYTRLADVPTGKPKSQFSVPVRRKRVPVSSVPLGYEPTMCSPITLPAEPWNVEDD